MARAVLSPEAARKLTALLRGSGEVARRDGMLRSVALPTEYPDPFAVQWAQSADNGGGSWIIWLPGSRLVMVGNNPVYPSAELEAVGGDYPAGWYILTDSMLDRDEGGTLYLNIAFPSGSYSATFFSSATAPSASDGTADQYINVRICDATVEESGERKVKQYVTSAIVFWHGRSGSSSGGGGGGNPDNPDNPDDPDDPGGDDDDSVVTSLNGADGDLQLVIEKGFFEIRKNGVLVANGLVGWLVESLNGITGDSAIIGGPGISVTTEGNSVRISANPDKTTSDDNPYPETSDSGCSHPNADGGVAEGFGGGGGGGGVDVASDEASDSGGGGGCTDCGGGSSIGSASGAPSAGASGAAAPAGTTSGASGKPAASAPSGTSGTGGSQASSGLFNGSTIPKKQIGTGAKTPIYSNTHGQLTNGKTMNQSPFKASGNFKPIGSGATTPIYSGSKAPIYSNTHGQLTNSKTMNESPFKAKARQQ